MVTSYKALLELAEIQTQNLNGAVQAVLARKQLKEKRQQEQEQKQRELEHRLRLWYFETQKKQKEAETKRIEELRTKEADLLLREAARREALRYGPVKARRMKKAKALPTCTRNHVLDDVEAEAGSVLNREEKRERRLQAERKNEFHLPLRSPQSTSRHRGRLPRGADRVTTSSADAVTAASHIKDRLLSMPNTLTLLNVVKRDTRTIDEIVRDRQKTTLEGDRARRFDGWFRPSLQAPIPLAKHGSELELAPRTTPIVLPQTFVVTNSTRKRPSSMACPTVPPPKRFRVAAGSPNSVSFAKPKSVPRSASHCGRQSNISEEIWGIFGKNKAAYVARDISDSDDDDAIMEADIDVVEREEKISERIARKEEQEAEMEEQRLMEEKHRRILGR